METLTNSSTELLESVRLKNNPARHALEGLAQVDSRYIRDLKINLQNVLDSEHLSNKETSLLALSVAVNERSEGLIQSFRESSSLAGASEKEIADAIACASLLASNNIFYRFRHFTEKEVYENLPARIKMNIMMNPSIGKEFFELISLAVSAVNGCERCVKAHEHSLIEMGSAPERIFDAIRLASVMVSLTKIVG